VISNGNPSNRTLELCSSGSMSIGIDLAVPAGYGRGSVDTTVYS
jgi:hypothetical protein